MRTLEGEYALHESGPSAPAVASRSDSAKPLHGHNTALNREHL
ncbi:MAG: hypothetical protein ABIA59_06235 [Candidatus Latescibacterota bacterium]